MANKKVIVNGVVFSNLGKYFESEMCMNQYFYGSYIKANSEDDLNGIDGYLNGEPIQVKISVHSDGGASNLHGYSVVHKTSQKKLKNVKFLVFCLPMVESYTPHYRLSHSINIIYKIDRVNAIKCKLFKYNSDGEIYLDKTKRKILDNMVKNGKAEMIDTFIVP